MIFLKRWLIEEDNQADPKEDRFWSYNQRALNRVYKAVPPRTVSELFLIRLHTSQKPYSHADKPSASSTRT
jgi:hypothetical protein